MDIVAINQAIETLENLDTTFDNVHELASLYIVRQNFQDGLKTMVEREYDDILPEYKQYCEIKRKYQLKEVSEGLVIKELKEVCREIEEFLHILYVGTDMNKERKILQEMLQSLVNTYRING